MTLRIVARDGTRYVNPGVSNVRLGKRELRWSSACGQPSQMALVFIGSWELT